MDLKRCAAIVGGWLAVCVGCGWLAGQLAQWLSMS